VDGTATLLTVNTSTCRSIHLDAVPGSDPDDPSTDYGDQKGQLSLLQETRDAVNAVIPARTVGSLDSALTVGKSWSIRVAYANASRYVFEWYVNGTASCDAQVSQ
jgi:hypothetical protein